MLRSLCLDLMVLKVIFVLLAVCYNCTPAFKQESIRPRKTKEVRTDPYDFNNTSDRKDIFKKSVTLWNKDETINSRVRKTVKREEEYDDFDDLIYELYDVKKARKDYTGIELAKLTTRVTKAGPMKARCSWDNKKGRREKFVAALIEFKKPIKDYHREYRKIVALENDSSVLWSSGADWPKKFTYNGTKYEAATGGIRQRSAYLNLYVTKKVCGKDQGYYRCTVFVQRPDKPLVFSSVTKRWMTIPCMHKYGRLQSKVAWGAGGSDANNLDQFLYEMKTVSGDALIKRSEAVLVEMMHRKFTYHYRRRKIVFEVLECRPSQGVKDKTDHFLGFVIEQQKKDHEYYEPIAGINDKDEVIWSDTVYWKETYVCGPERKRCPMAYGSIIDDPYMVLYINDCKKNLGQYKCTMFIQLTGSPASEAIQSQIRLTSCDQKEEAVEVIATGSKKTINVQRKKKPLTKEEEDNTADSIIGAVVALVLLLLLVYLVKKTKKNMEEKREREEKIMLMHKQKNEGGQVKKSSQNLLSGETKMNFN